MSLTLVTTSESESIIEMLIYNCFFFALFTNCKKTKPERLPQSHCVLVVA